MTINDAEYDNWYDEFIEAYKSLSNAQKISTKFVVFLSFIFGLVIGYIIGVT